MSPKSCSMNYSSKVDLYNKQVHGIEKMTSLPLVLAGGWAEAEVFAHALAELFPLFRRPGLAAL